MGGGPMGQVIRDRVRNWQAARARLRCGDRAWSGAQTDDNGRHEIGGLAAGRCVVAASKTGFVTVNRTAPRFDPNASADQRRAAAAKRQLQPAARA
jgi:hypothetical protein